MERKICHFRTSLRLKHPTLPLGAVADRHGDSPLLPFAILDRLVPPFRRARVRAAPNGKEGAAGNPRSSISQRSGDQHQTVREGGKKASCAGGKKLD